MAFFKKKRTASELGAEREKLIAEKADARRKLDALVEGRREIELYGELDELQRHDAETAREKLIVDRANARVAQIDRDERALADEVEQARRQAVYDAASKAHAEGKAALRDYERFAASAAEALKRYATAKAAIDSANAALPEGRAPLNDPEPDNTVPMYAPKSFAPFSVASHELPRPAIPHISILRKAVLPTLKRGDYFFGGDNISRKH